MELIKIFLFLYRYGLDYKYEVIFLIWNIPNRESNLTNRQGQNRNMFQFTF